MLKTNSLNLKKSARNFHESVASAVDQVPLIDVYDPQTKTLVKSSTQSLKQSFYKPQQKPAVNVVYQVVYPDDLNLKPGSGYQKTKSRVGRPKKSKVPQLTPIESNPPVQKSKIQVVAKTRSGREVKFPKHIQNDFKKIVTDDTSAHDTEIQTADFVSYTETDKSKNDKDQVIEEKLTGLDSVQKKRRIAAQYRCPKCQKAYLGRSKILEHLRKNPTHGPMQQSEENHFEIWNYLVAITQKCPSSERGRKFCQELSNLLHNLVLLTNALFKKMGNASNEVKVDKVLGNAIGLVPGTYYFDDNNLYKDVTVLKLMSNTDFLNSIRSKSDENIARSTESNCSCGKANEVKLDSSSADTNDDIVKKIDSIRIDKSDAVQGSEDSGAKQFAGQDFFLSSDVYSTLNDYEMKSGLEASVDSIEKDAGGENQAVSQTDSCKTESDADEKAFVENDYCNNFSMSYGSNNDHLAVQEKSGPKSPKIKIQSNILICPPNTKLLQSNFNSETSPNKNLLNADLLIDSSVLLPISNLNHGVDELMLPVSEETAILDNSSSSDEVMNVDQFVNERFRRITESDGGVNGSAALNLDLPALGLFHFNSA